MTDVSIPFFHFLLCILRIILHYVLANYLFMRVTLSLSLFFPFYLLLSFFPSLPLFLSISLTHTHTILISAMLTEAVFYASTTSGYIIRSGTITLFLSFIHSFYYIPYLCLHF